jgi:hypothetical protein
VARREPKDGGGYHNTLYKVVEVPLGHTEASSSDDVLTLQWFSPTTEDAGKDGGSVKFKLQPREWGNTTNKDNFDGTFTANTMAWVDPTAVTVTKGKISNKKTCELELELDEYCTAYHKMSLSVEALEDGNEEKELDGGGHNILEDDSGDESDGGGKQKDAPVTIDRSSLNAVLGSLPMFLNTKSMLEELLEEHEHILLLSAKYHAECAGQGIEYCFGRCKWWFKKHNRGSTAALKQLSAKSFSHDVVSVDHCRKFARKNRDYHRVYRGKVTGLDADRSVKLCKTHRCALDTDFTFITECLENECYAVTMTR